MVNSKESSPLSVLKISLKVNIEEAYFDMNYLQVPVFS